MFERDGGGGRSAFNVAYSHGSGGTAPVTRGVIKTNRRSVVFPDADIFLSGHIHERWAMEIPRIRLTEQGEGVQGRTGPPLHTDLQGRNHESGRRMGH